MKTHFYLTTLLALTIQVMVNGQTPGNQTERTLPTIGGKSVNQQDLPKEFRISTNTNVVEEAKNNVYYSHDSRTELLKQAEGLLSDAKFLYNEAETRSGVEKEVLLKQANIIAKQAEANQIKAAEIAGKINKETFKINKENLNAILAISNSEEEVEARVKELMFDAGQNMRQATEMREEAYAMPTTASKLGSLVNAEEKEGVAINKQTKAVEILKDNNPEIAGNIKNILSGNTVATK